MAFLTISSYSQEGSSSPYSFYGIGSLKFKGTVENRSMGGLSVYADSIHVNLRNPASYAGENLKVSPFNDEGRPIKFAIGGEYSSVKLKTNEGSDKASSTSFEYLAIAIPAGKLGFGFGIVPFSSVGYKLESTIPESELTDNIYRGEGGVNKAFLGVGYQLTKGFSIGIDVNYNFGNIQNSSIKFLYDDDDEPLQYQSRESNRSDLSGLNFNFGARYKAMVSPKLELTSAFTYSPSSDLTSKNVRTFETLVINPFSGAEGIVNQIEVDLESSNLDETTLTLPARTSFGAGIGEPRKWFIGAEYTSLKTSDFSNRIFEIENASFEDASTISFGGFYIPQYTSFTKYWKRVVYQGWSSI